MIESRNKSDESRLGFEADKYLLNDFHKVTEDFKNRLSAYHCDFVKGYEEGKFHVVLNCVISSTGEQFDFLFSAIPNGIDLHTDQRSSSIYIAEFGSDRDVEEFVFVRDRHFVECPENVISSFVRLVRAKNRTNFFRNVLGPTLDCVIEFDSTASERKGGMFGADLSRSDGQCVTDIVKRRPEVLNGLLGEVGEGIRHGPSKSELMELMLRFVRIRLYKRAAWAVCEEVIPLPFEIRNVFLCSRDLPA